MVKLSGLLVGVCSVTLPRGHRFQIPDKVAWLCGFYLAEFCELSFPGVGELGEMMFRWVKHPTMPAG